MSGQRDTLQTVVGGATALVLIAVLVVVLVPQAIGAEASFVVLSGSMEPAIGAGDVVVVESTTPDRIEEGDVITFTDGTNPDVSDRTDRVTHRVIEVNRSDDGVRFRTKGDANEDPDPGFVTPDQLIGEVWFTVPVIGRAVVFAGSRLGTVLLVVVPGVLLVVNELYAVYRDAEADDDTSNDENDNPTSERDSATPSDERDGGDAGDWTDDGPESEDPPAGGDGT